MLRTLRDPTSHSRVLGMEAFKTIASYSPDAADTIALELKRAGRRLIREEVRIGYEAFFDLVPQEHLEFLKSLRLCHRTPDVFCVHGGILDDRALSLRNPETMIWGPQGFPGRYHGRQAVVYGHWDNAVMHETGWPGALYKGKRHLRSRNHFPWGLDRDELSRRSNHSKWQVDRWEHLGKEGQLTRRRVFTPNRPATRSCPQYCGRDEDFLQAGSPFLVNVPGVATLRTIKLSRHACSADVPGLALLPLNITS